ncbi:hypothetical protein P7D17_08715 [Lactococcus petauri]|uniref:Uncharacterized protein n=1 Tax=Lactococcus petauri TaxID=1940789 RepID=A0AAJ2IVQ4_9LACT|nr:MULTISPECIES: hypothetical protein [Lactococcus]MBS4463496.1 hypothetical protein [Lactococcus garvieae]MDT2584179.1 hypothetical protein [Lactococcus petauri]
MEEHQLELEQSLAILTDMYNKAKKNKEPSFEVNAMIFDGLDTREHIQYFLSKVGHDVNVHYGFDITFTFRSPQ